MNRREFFAMAAAAAATSALPGIASADEVSGLIVGKRFVLTEPITLEVSGPILIKDCEFLANFPADDLLYFARRGQKPHGIHAVTIFSDCVDEPIEISNCRFGLWQDPKEFFRHSVEPITNIIPAKA